MNRIVGFFAYPDKPAALSKAVEEAVRRYTNKHGGNKISTWKESDIAGRPLTGPILGGIEQANVLFADITNINFNVTFEIGFAIGSKKRVFLVRNSSLHSEESKELTNRIGIFDTLGYGVYSEAEGLLRLLLTVKDVHPLDTTVELNRENPAYILEPPIRTQIVTTLVSKIKKARLFYRSFVPGETPRLSAQEAVSHVASSYGVIIPLLSPDVEDAKVHNMRAAFVAGISIGMDLPTLILQHQSSPLAPLDIRDFVKSYFRPEDLTKIVNDFSLLVFEKLQKEVTFELPPGNPLSKLVVGDPMAENELRTLGRYYLITDEYNRAERGEVNLVVGRKGTGKTALFSQLRNKKRAHRDNIVVDLKPEGYQLLKLKEEVIPHLSSGEKHHLVTALWEYLLYSEICRMVLRRDKQHHVRDHRLFEGYQLLRDANQKLTTADEGDFSERLMMLSDSVVESFKVGQMKHRGGLLQSGEITGMVHSLDIKKLRNSLSQYLRHKKEIWLLFDNLDKGWSGHEIKEVDISILRCLIDAARKVQRAMSQDKHEFHAVIFIRNDVYQLLMDESADFGKETRANLDWSDPDLLRSMLLKRLVQNAFPKDTPFEKAWSSICVSHIESEESSQFMIDRSLMRPRNLLKLFNACRGFAVNLQHEKIEADDIGKGLETYSNDLLIDADNELTDIEPRARRLIYQFLDESSEFSRDDLSVLLSEDLEESDVSRIIEFLLYYGFLGIRYANHEPKYIYNVGYNMEIFKVQIEKNKKALKYVLNPAFWPALNTQN